MFKSLKTAPGATGTGAESGHWPDKGQLLFWISHPRAPVAQLVEHETFNLRVTGSSPVRRMAKGPVV
jgi:hypothetical protein